MGILGAMVIGFFFCLTLRRTGNLWFAVGFHAAWDWGESYFYSVPDSGGMAPGHLLHSSLQGPRWLTGGSVGPEGSVFLFVLLALLWVVFDRVYPEVKYPGSDSSNPMSSAGIVPAGSGASCPRGRARYPPDSRRDAGATSSLPRIVHGVGHHLLAIGRDGHRKLDGLRIGLA